MNKSEIMNKIAELTAMLNGCDCGEESQVYKPSPNQSSVKHYYLASSNGVYSGGGGDPQWGVVRTFRNKETAEAYAKALNVILELRTQKGVVKAVNGDWQYMIEGKMEFDGDSVRLEVRERRDHSVKFSRCFSPCFDTEENAKAAINAVGANRILSAMQALSWADTEN